MVRLKEVKGLAPVKLVHTLVVVVVVVVISRGEEEEEEDSSKVEEVMDLSLNREVVGMASHHSSTVDQEKVSHHSTNTSNSTVDQEEDHLEVGTAVVAVEVRPLLDSHRDNQFPSCIKLPHQLIKRCLLSLHRLR